MKCQNILAPGWPLRDTAIEDALVAPWERPGLLATGGGNPARRLFLIIPRNAESVNPKNHGGPKAQDGDRVARLAPTRTQTARALCGRVGGKSPGNQSARARLHHRKKWDRAALLTAAEAAHQLGIARSTFFLLLDRLTARGLRFVLIPSPTDKRPIKRYVAASIDRIIAETLKAEKDKEALLC